MQPHFQESNDAEGEAVLKLIDTFAMKIDNVKIRKDFFFDQYLCHLGVYSIHYIQQQQDQ